MSDYNSVIMNSVIMNSSYNLEDAKYLVVKPHLETAVKATSKLAEVSEKDNSNAFVNACMRATEAKAKVKQLSAKLDSMMKDLADDFDKTADKNDLNTVLNGLTGSVQNSVDQQSVFETIRELNAAVSEATKATELVNALAAMEAEDLRKLSTTTTKTATMIGFATRSITDLIEVSESPDQLKSLVCFTMLNPRC
jgi:hypothetical protein